MLHCVSCLPFSTLQLYNIPLNDNRMGKLRAKFTDYPQLPLTPSTRSNKKSSDRTGNFLRYINFSIDKLYIFIFPLDS